MNRRDFLVLTGASALALAVPGGVAVAQGERQSMYGLIGKMNVAEGRRDEVVEILLEGVSGMPGCLSYVVAKDPEDPNAIWITEVWDRQESHEGSLSLPSVQEAIRKARPHITGFGERFETEPVGGHGLERG